VDHEETSIGELDTDDLQRDTVDIGVEEDDEIHLDWVR
jgi:hypothetical protein